MNPFKLFTSHTTVVIYLIVITRVIAVIVLIGVHISTQTILMVPACRNQTFCSRESQEAYVGYMKMGFEEDVSPLFTTGVGGIAVMSAILVLSLRSDKKSKFLIFASLK
jgi:hypothetical protein